MALSAKERKMRRMKANITAFAAIFLALVIAISAVVIFTKGNDDKKKPEGSFINNIIQTTEDPTPKKITEITIGSTGDVLMHKPVYSSCYNSSSKAYDFTELFRYVAPNIQKYDYFVANLETTLAGNENGRKYTSYPCFNTPDPIADALKNAGVDCLLTANNHCYDTATHGIHRTQQIISEKGFDYVGTVTDPANKRYIVEDIKGIKVGIACFTYETKTDPDRKAINGILVSKETDDLINSFNYDRLDEFYTELGSQLEGMKNEGAEVLTVYIHWGDEYTLKANSYQEKMAQKMCDMGVDVIVGGHPHVVQPVDLLSSTTDPEHKTVCVYSLGNMVSNQRRQNMRLKSGHTEDGMIFEMTFSKYSDGTVVFEKVNVVPTWVHMYTSGGKRRYNVVPLVKDLSSSADSLGLNKTSSGKSSAESSYKRTWELVEEGLVESNNYLSSLPRPDEKKAETTSQVS